MKEGYQRIKIKHCPPSATCQFIEALRLRISWHAVTGWCQFGLYTWVTCRFSKKWINTTFRWLSQPLGYDDIFDHAKLQREIKTDLCLDEGISFTWRYTCRHRNEKLPHYQYQGPGALADILNLSNSWLLCFDEHPGLAWRNARIRYWPVQGMLPWLHCLISLCQAIFHLTGNTIRRIL